MMFRLQFIVFLFASIAAPLHGGAEEFKVAAPAATRSEGPKDAAAAGKLNLVGEVKNRADVLFLILVRG